MSVPNAPRRYRKLPIEITAMQLREYGDFVRSADWINTNGGRARFAPRAESDRLLIDTPEGTMEALQGWYVIRGIESEFYACKESVFTATYEAVEEPQTAASHAEEPTGLYVPRGAPEATSGPSLQGGAALQMPSG